MGLHYNNCDELERRLRKDVREYLKSVRQAGLKPHNAESILLRLTGKRFDDLQNAVQIECANMEVETALLRERKKARMKHRDYDLNRHIALHQAKKTLAELSVQSDALSMRGFSRRIQEPYRQ